MNWRKTFTNINDVNNGQEFENSDYPTKEAFNIALNNTQALKDMHDNEQATLLWSQSPSGMIEADYTISNLTNYNYLIIGYKQDVNTTDVIEYVTIKRVNSGNCRISKVIDDSNYTRDFTFNGNNLHISNCRIVNFNGGTGTSSVKIIPFEIWGKKVL